MKKNELERALQRVPPHTKPRADLEQYATPAWIATDILYIAYANGDIQDCEVVDLGCGGGIFSIGASLLGARRVIGVDIDPGAAVDCRKNASTAGVVVEVITADVRDIILSSDTVVMNPPFGAQHRHADRPFLEAAVRIAPRTYSLHNARTEEFLRSMVRSMGAEIFLQKSYKFEIPHMFEFHDRKKKEIEVTLLGINSPEVNK
jgi:putative methylase